jgi:hypothetical protein
VAFRSALPVAYRDKATADRPIGLPGLWAKHGIVCLIRRTKLVWLLANGVLLFLLTYKWWTSWRRWFSFPTPCPSGTSLGLDIWGGSFSAGLSIFTEVRCFVFIIRSFSDNAQRVSSRFCYLWSRFDPLPAWCGCWCLRTAHCAVRQSV